MKKLLSFMLTLVMVLSMTTAAFAADYSITVSNDSAVTNASINGNTYQAYKLLDMTHSDANFNEDTAIAYTVAEAFEGFTYTVGTETYSGKTLITYIGTLTDNSDELNAFAEAAWNYISKTPVAATKTVEAANETATFELDDAGYYLVYGAIDPNAGVGEGAEAEIVAACALTNTKPAADVNVKAEAPTIDKVIVNADDGKGNGTAVEVGDVVDFKLTSKVPVMTGYESYTYVVTDTLSTGLTFNNDVAVKIGADTLVKDTDYTVAVDGQTFTITMVDFIKRTEGAGIEITYSATLNSNALTTKEETNTVNLTYSNDPYDTTSSTKTPDDVVYVYDFDIDLDKYAEKNAENKLANAEFVLANADQSAYYKVDAATGVVSWYTLAEGETLDAAITADKVTKVTTDANGAGTFAGLDAGSYKLVEVKAPAGYNLLDAPVNVEIKAQYASNGQLDTTSEGTITNVTSDEPTSTTAKVQYHLVVGVKNTTGTLLPTTGGMGTVLFYVIGGLLVFGSVVLLITKKRMNSVQ